MQTKKLISCLGLMAITMAGTVVKAQQPANGETLFKQTCIACHSIGNGKLVGPDLKGVTTRRTEAWLVKFIKSSQTLIKSGDKAAVALFNENNKIVMPDHALTDAQVKSILAYIKKK